MLKEQEMTEIGFCFRVEIPTEPADNGLSDSEQIRVALDKVTNRLLQNFTVTVPPFLLHSEQRVSIVLSVNYKMPEGTSEKDSELRSMFELDYWNNIPADWKPRYIGTKLNGKFVSIHL